MSLGGKKSNEGKQTTKAGKEAIALGKPMIEKASATADKAESFGDSFYDQYIKPQMDQLNTVITKAQADNQTITSDLLKQYQDREATYQQNKDLISSYGDTIRNFDAGQEGARTTALALGDLSTARAANDAAVARGLQARGINPTSGAAAAGLRSTATADALARAGIAARERQRAEELGRQLKASGAQMGMNLSNTAPALQLASGSVGQSVAIPAAGVDVANAGAATPFKGYGLSAGTHANLGSNLYSAGLSGISKGEEINFEANKDNGSGFGALAGTVLGGLGGFMLGGPTGALTGAQIGSGLFK